MEVLLRTWGKAVDGPLAVRGETRGSIRQRLPDREGFLKNSGIVSEDWEDERSWGVEAAVWREEEAVAEGSGWGIRLEWKWSEFKSMVGWQRVRRCCSIETCWDFNLLLVIRRRVRNSRQALSLSEEVISISLKLVKVAKVEVEGEAAEEGAIGRGDGEGLRGVGEGEDMMAMT
jgi:hypothetical protein